MAKAKFPLPARIATVTGKLEVLGGHRGEFTIRCSRTYKLFLLSEGDRVKTANWSAVVKFTYHGKDKLNGNSGTLITLPEVDEWGYARHIFFWCMPAARADMQPWLDSYLAGETVTVSFVAKPLAEHNTPYISGQLEPFHEQGMEGNIGWALTDTQKHSYAALHMLEEGDELTIFDKHGRSVLWQGVMTARRLENLRRSCYGRGETLTEETKFLSKCFFQRLPAVVKRKNLPKKK